MEIEVNGHRLNVEQQGPVGGPSVVLLHHGLGAARSWRDTLPVLAAAGYFVTAYDRWGYGKSTERPALGVPYFQQDVADLMSILRELGLRKPVLVGHSDGGTIALYMAACCVEALSGLVTVAAHIYIEPKMIPGLLAVGQEHDENKIFREGMARMHGGQADAVFDNWFNGWRSLQANNQMDWDMRPLLGRITCPTLVMQGVEDEHATPQHAEDIAAGISGAQLCLIPKGRHMLPQDSPAAFHPRLLDFLKGVQ